VELEFTPEPSETERDAVLAALVAAEIRLERPLPAYGSPWRRAGLEDGVERAFGLASEPLERH
jgi:hypothetical protein